LQVSDVAGAAEQQRFDVVDLHLPSSLAAMGTLAFLMIKQDGDLSGRCLAAIGSLPTATVRVVCALMDRVAFRMGLSPSVFDRSRLLRVLSSPFSHASIAALSAAGIVFVCVIPLPVVMVSAFVTLAALAAGRVAGGQMATLARLSSKIKSEVRSLGFLDRDNFHARICIMARGTELA
jgi:acid phosphatase family membrane protein YuiD